MHLDLACPCPCSPERYALSLLLTLSTDQCRSRVRCVSWLPMSLSLSISPVSVSASLTCVLRLCLLLFPIAGYTTSDPVRLRRSGQGAPSCGCLLQAVNLGHGTAGSKQRSKVYYVRYLSSCRLPYQIRTRPLSYCALPNIEQGSRLGTYSSLPVHETLEMMTVVTVAGITPKRPSNVVVSSRVWPDMTNFPACRSANTECHIPRSTLPHLVTWTINRIVLETNHG